MLRNLATRWTLHVVALLAVALLMLSIATPAFAALEDDPKATSSTNPSALSESTWWRGGWGNSLFPDVHFTLGADPGLPTLGFVYRFDRVRPGVPAIDATTGADPLVETQNHWSNLTTGSTFSGVFDLMRYVDDPPLAGWPSFPGASSLAEGSWYVHIQPRNMLRYGDAEFMYHLGYDATPPTAVTSFHSDVSSATWTTTQRRRLTWWGATDALSGVGAYEVTVANKRLGSRTTTVTTPITGVDPTLVSTFQPWLWPEPTRSLTVEDLGPGLSTITIRTLDRAANRSPAASLQALVDTDTPKVSITAPAASMVGRSATFAATASDLAGIASVKFYVDGALKGTDTTAPYALAFNTSTLKPGSHTLQVIATDMIGRTASASKVFGVDLTPPVVSSFTAGPNPFYPRLMDGFRDYSTATFRLSEAASIRFVVTRANGTWAWEYRKSLPAGAIKLSWNGRDSKGNVMPQGTYYYRVIATDPVGNTYTSGLVAATIKYYLVVRVSASKAITVAH